MVSAKDENFSVHSAIQTFVRFLLEDSLPRGKKMLKMSEMTEDGDAETETVVMSPQQTLLPQTGVIEVCYCTQGWSHEVCHCTYGWSHEMCHCT